MNESSHIEQVFSEVLIVCVPSSPCHPGNCAPEEGVSVYGHTGSVSHCIIVCVHKLKWGFAGNCYRIIVKR